MAINQRQQRFLLDRLEGIHSSKPNGWDSCKIPHSDAVKRAQRQIKAAQRIVKAHERKEANRRTKRNDAIHVTVSNIKQVILFGDAKKAVVLLDAFEKKTF